MGIYRSWTEKTIRRANFEGGSLIRSFLTLHTDQGDSAPPKVPEAWEGRLLNDCSKWKILRARITGAVRLQATKAKGQTQSRLRARVKARTRWMHHLFSTKNVPLAIHPADLSLFAVHNIRADSIDILNKKFYSFLDCSFNLSSEIQVI